MATDREISAQDARQALERVLKSEVFSHSERINAFLSYVVAEFLAGRGASIRGKTIAQDVYHRAPQEGADTENIVRVHARQLRQNLGVYYETDGSRDPVRIHMDSGTYCPRFETVQLPEPEAGATSLRGTAIVLGVFLAGGVIGGGVASLLLKDSPVSGATLTNAESRQAQLAREAVLEKSPAALQAQNFALQARGMIFPIFDRPRQLLMTSVFEHVVDLDPSYYGGYAGAAQTLATLAIVIPPGPERDEALDRAGSMAEQAIRLGAAEPWAQSANAWVQFARGNHDYAYELSRRALEMAPQDGHVVDFHGAIALFSGRFEEAIDAADRIYATGRSNQRFASRNIYGAANFHLGEYRKTLRGLEAAAAFGDPVSPPSFAYQVAALQKLGRSSEARRKLEDLERAWPGARLDVILYTVHQHRRDADAVLSPLRDIGWAPDAADPPRQADPAELPRD